MRFIFGVFFGLLLGALVAMLLAAQNAGGEPDDAAIFGTDDGAPAPAGAAR